MKSSIFTEEWRDIPGYEGLYQVSNLGKVRSLDRKVMYNDGRIYEYKGCIRKPTMYRGGYFQVQLSKNDNIKIHRLVATVFQEQVGCIEEAKDKPFAELDVNHINECKWDNAVWNLEWCTKGYNHKYGHHYEKISKSRTGRFTYNNHPKSKPVLQYTLDGQFVKEWDCIKRAAEALGIYPSSITMVLTGRHKTAGGYVWKLKNNI